MDDFDYWRLCDELNVVQAALLLIGEDATQAGDIEDWDVEKRPKGYEAAKTAITHALRKYMLYRDSANREVWNTEEDYEYEQSRMLSTITGNLIPLYDYDINGNQCAPFDGSIDLLNSTIEVYSLKQWLKNRGFNSGFFFPKGNSEAPDYLDPQNPRFAPKLAAAVKAWQAVTDSGKKSPKQALDKWLRENAAHFGLADDEGNPINQAIEDCSKVANWNQTGGAPKTPA